MKSIFVFPLNHNQHSKNCNTFKREQSLHLWPFCWGILNSIRNLIIYTDCGGCDNVQITIEIMITKRDEAMRCDARRNPNRRRTEPASINGKCQRQTTAGSFFPAFSWLPVARCKSRARIYTHTHTLINTGIHLQRRRPKSNTGYLARRSQQLVALVISVTL